MQTLELDHTETPPTSREERSRVRSAALDNVQANPAEFAAIMQANRELQAMVDRLSIDLANRESPNHSSSSSSMPLGAPMATPYNIGDLNSSPSTSVFQPAVPIAPASIAPAVTDLVHLQMKASEYHSTPQFITEAVQELHPIYFLNIFRSSKSICLQPGYFLSPMVHEVILW